MFGHSLTNLETKEKPRTIHGEVIKKNIQGVASLIENGVNPNLQDEEGNTPLHIIALDDDDVNIAIAKLLLKKGADPNLKNQEGKAPLHTAAVRKNFILVSILLESEKTNVNLPDEFGWTPLFYAVDYEGAFYQVEDIIRALLERGASRNYQNKKGETPLHIAARKGRRNTIDMLIAWGAEVNVQNKAGETPLYIAVVAGESGIVERLINCGADVNIESHAGYTPFYLAATGWFSYYDRGNEPEYRPLFKMVKIFLDRKEDTIDWKDEGYRKKLLKDIGDERIKELLIPVFQRVAMWDLWIMKTAEYESYLQWLPQELVEDIQWSFFRRDHILKRKRIAEEEERENAKRFCQDLVNFSYSP